MPIGWLKSLFSGIIGVVSNHPPENIMVKNPIFEVLVLLGRPAAGKSEILEHLRYMDPSSRMRKFHIGELDVIDDFPMLWTWLEEDDILSKKFAKQRLHTDEDGYFIFPYLWNLLIERIGLDYQKHIRDDLNYHQHTTAIVEFSRGSQHGGYQQAFENLSDQILARAGIVYVQVSFAESFRKNRLRFNPQRPDSILEHALEDEKLERLYRDDDWHELIAKSNSASYLKIQGIRVPYVIFENEDDVTTQGGAPLTRRLQETLGRLWDIQGLGKSKIDAV
jgi:hypothetical protein